ncbi:hypothetical protein BDV97DRAFT_299269 [Delphinella strobiligena]|nr:hypothetical protein BDV97DRAFT_299269 [Delphinella strobiligena]
MDEDERLLASEEGKKLSSKERRQLRNKVSARAFRSRRKGQKTAMVRSLMPLLFGSFFESLRYPLCYSPSTSHRFDLLNSHSSKSKSEPSSAAKGRVRIIAKVRTRYRAGAERAARRSQDYSDTERENRRHNLSTGHATPKLRGVKNEHHIIFPPFSTLQDAHHPISSPQEIYWYKMRSYLQFLTTPTADTPGSTLLLHFDNKRYLFGSIAEGTQRSSVQTGIRLLKVSEIFITGKTQWKNTGGLIGMILTLADAATLSAATSAEDARKKLLTKLRREGNDHVNEAQIADQLTRERKERTRLRIFGPPNLNYMLATARRFVFRKGMPVDVREFAHTDSDASKCSPTWSDENIDVWAMPIVPGPGRPSHIHQSNGAGGPRKRSYDELMGTQTANDDDPTYSEKASMMAKSVVSEMFDSTWRLDALVETPINEVKLPAALFVKDEVTGKTVKYTGPMPGGTQPVPDIKVMVRRPWPGVLVESLPPIEPAKEAVSYIVKNHFQRGKFRPQRAMELEVEMGVKWSRLSKGENVQNIHGQTITPDMVLEQGKEGGGAAIIDLPSVDYVESLVNRPEWKIKEIMTGLGAFVWMLGPGVAESPLLQKFMSDMKDMQHIISSPELCPNTLSMESAAEATARLQLVDPARYAIPLHSNSESLERCVGRRPDEFLSLSHMAHRGLRVHLEPSIEVERDNGLAPVFNLDEVRNSMSPEVLQAASEAQNDIRESKVGLDAWADKLPQKDVEIITLGTGSALPSKYRNVSATLVRVPGWGSLLLDCGENTLGQLKRIYTRDQLAEVLQDLRAIWISHMHADHHLGTVSVIRAWYETVHHSNPVPTPSPSVPGFSPGPLFQNQKRLSVISDAPMLHWLHEYSSVEDYGFSRLAPLHITPAHPPTNTLSQLNWFLPPSSVESDTAEGREPWSYKMARGQVSASAVDLPDIQAVLVHHCHGARAVSITFPTGFKVSYSGDCRPSKAFAQIGKGSTVCIHEATFDDELQGDAEAKNHCTTSEALSVALAMNAQACVLTHFSQRYQKVPVLEMEDVSTNPDDSLDAPVADVTATTRAESTEVAAPTQTETKQTTIKLKRGTEMKVCVAFDLMRVKVGEIAQLEKLSPALIKLFAEEETEEVQESSDTGKAKSQTSKKQKPAKSKRNN